MSKLYDTFYVKYCLGDCKNLDDVIEQFDSIYEYFKELKELGVKLQEHDGGFLHLEIPKKIAEEYCELSGMKYKDLLSMNEGDKDE